MTKKLDFGQGRRVELFAEAFNLTNFVNVTGGASNIRLATLQRADRRPGCATGSVGRALFVLEVGARAHGSP